MGLSFLRRKWKQAVGGHQFLTYQKLAPGKISTFQRAMRTPPFRVVEVTSQNSTRPKVTEKAVIECVLYSDASVWRSPIAREGVCDLLKNGKTALMH